MLSFGATIHMVAAEQYFLVELLILLYKPEGLLTLEFVEDILWCYQTVLSCTMAHLYSTFNVLYISLCEVILNSEYVNKNLINILILYKSLYRLCHFSTVNGIYFASDCRGFCLHPPPVIALHPV